MLRPLSIPGLFITATDTGVGKTVIAAAVAKWLALRGRRVGVCKIAATGCLRRGEHLISEDAEFLAVASGSSFPLEIICPIRYAEPLAPAVAAERAGVPLDWSLLQSSLDTLASQSDCLIVEGVGGIMVPMDDQHTVLDVAKWLGLPTIVVARPGLGTINHTLLTVNALRSAGVQVAAIVINRYPAAGANLAEETSPAEIAKWVEKVCQAHLFFPVLLGENVGKGRTVPLLLVPDEPFSPPVLPSGVIAAVNQIDWVKLIQRSV